MSVFDKLHELKDSLDHHSSQPVPAGDAKGQEEVRAEMHGEERREEEIQSKEGWSHKIKDVLDGGNARKKREEEEELLRIENEKEEARKKIEATRGWTGKIHDILDGGKHKEELELEEFQRLEDQAQAEQKKGDHLSQKIRDALDTPNELHRKVHELTHSEHKVAESEAEEQKHLSDKVKDLWEYAPSEEKVVQNKHHHIWEHKADDERTQRDEGWREKLRALSGTPKKNEKKQVERGWLMEKLNEMAGGGPKSEENEDKLDKTVDFIQEHILRQGDQSNESALEQMKDEQISDVIRLAYRQVIGHELPVKHKK